MSMMRSSTGAYPGRHEVRRCRADDDVRRPGDARVGLDFLLQVLGELLVGLSGDDRQPVDLEAAHTFAVLVHAQPQASADGLPAFALSAHFAQGANLEHVGVVPTLPER